MPPHLQGPVFLQEPPPWLEFSNSTGAVISCSAHGSPPPEIRWLDASDKELPHLSRLRELLGNGSLYFPPFPPEDYAPEVHAAVYRCRASNPVGVILSRDCRIRADVVQAYQLQVHNVFVMRGNIAVLRCNVPSFVRGLLTVTTWLRDEPLLGRAAVHPGGRFTVTASGALHVRDTSAEDGYSRYFCQTVHKLTGERRLSLPGQIIVTEPEANVPPRVEHSVPNVNVRAGNPADLVCAAQGFPPPTYTWYRDMDGSLMEVRAGSVLVRPLQSVLQFPRAQLEDAARYVCVAANQLGEDRREVVLAVVTPLAIHIRPQQQVVDAGSTAMFNCSVQGGSRDVHITWLKDGHPLLEGARIELLHAREVLLIRAARKQDRGMYQCVGRSGEETAQGSAELTMGAVTPELQSTFIEQTLQPGPPVSLRCAASGNPPPRIVWLLDGGELLQRGYVLGSFLDAAGDVVSHLNISSARVQHGGLYTCVARNVLGAVQHSAQLNIYGPPSARGPQNLTVVAGLDVYLRCPVAGFPISSVTWQRSGDILPSHLRHRVFTNGTLLVRQVEGVADRGEYTCAVTNQQGQSAQGRLHLEVMKPPQIAPFAFPDNLQEGMRAQVSCSIISGDFPISITWRKDGGPLPQESDVQEQHHQFVSNLMFSNLAARHSGHYTCIASNAAAVANFTAKLTVRVAPTWITEPQDVSVLYQHSVALHCQAGGFPTPSITWMKAKGGHPSEFGQLDPGHRLFVSSNGSVLIRAADPTHEGHYTCQASNGIGSGLSKVIFLRVNVPAHFRSRTANHSAAANERATLVCAAEGDLPLRLSWSAQHRPLPAPVTERQTASGVTAELHLEALSRRDAGAYRCAATNDFGQDEMTIYLTVKEPPEAPGRVEVLESTSRWVRVTWSAPYAGHAPISHYLVQFREDEDALAWSNVTVDGAARTAKLGTLRPATNYRLRLVAVNEVGAGPPSETTLAQTLQEAPSAPPIDVTADATSSESLLVRWKPPLASYANGEILGYQVSYREKSAVSSQQLVRSVRGRHRLELALTTLRHFTRYEITVRAFNQVGAGPPSPVLIAATLEGVPDAAPLDLRCTALSPQSVRVRWDPPPPDNWNGLIEGYKVVYKQVNGTLGGTPDVEVKKTTNLETNLHGLAKFTNYSVRVLAFTASGEGVRSTPVHCMTEEDVPGAPEQIKVHAMTSDSVMVSWTRPVEPNGNIIKYNVYIHPMQLHGAKEVLKESVFGDRELLYEVHRLKETQRYEFWVTASTVVGEGVVSAKVAQTPTSRAPAKIASFSSRVVAGAGRTVTLACASVGLPKPSRSWRGPSAQLQRSERDLTLGPLTTAHAGNYTCRVENMFGSDEIAYRLQVQVPPGAPALAVVAASERSISVQWRLSDDGGSPVTGYRLSYKREFGEWMDVWLESDRKSYVLDGVKCGCNYQLHIAASNSVGAGQPSSLVTATTKGGAPRVPQSEDLLSVNSTSVTLFLDAWPSGGCPMQYFVVEYRPRGQHGWTLISNNIRQEELVLPDLQPASWYSLRIAAHNDAGSSHQEFLFATKTRTGENILLEPPADVSERQSSFFSRLNVVVPIVSGIICTVAAAICICIIVHRRHYAGYKQGDPGYVAKSLAELQNERNTEQGVTQPQLYSPSPARKGDSSLSAHKGSDTSGRQHLGQDYEICPYATFSLPGAPPAQTMDYSVQFQTFGQQDCYAARPSTSSGYYSRVRAKSRGAESKSRTSKSPPDGLSLAEISCISSQQTLPMSAAISSSSGAHHRRVAAAKSPPNQIARSRSCSMGTDRDGQSDDSDSSGAETSPMRSAEVKPVQYRVPTNHGRVSKTPVHEAAVFELDSSTESTEASPEVNHRARRSAAGRRGVPSRHRTRGSGLGMEVVPLQPPSGFLDSRELSEAECDREAGRNQAPGLPLFRHEELQQELSTLVKRYRQERDREKQDYTIHV